MTRKNYSNIVVRTCKKCKKAIDERSLHDYCPDCFRIIDEVFEKIRAYLKEYPGATAFEIELETGIPYHVVNNFVRDGRLIEIENNLINIECKRCGCLLLSANHKYCPRCRDEIQREMEHAKEQLQAPMPIKEKAKMHFQVARRDKS
ncbi:putative amidophosphoribosyltransferase [Anaerosolibacter carboniphilus]|uniref:Putative amidophosphoribosyltransferase n=1 Tax=Anaerosolibacter carboniphilus TaxID=1417629 RepID=A0A841L5W8_9FIRM|nr:hypothetical protein [Anaerosolibacter carboniphilus]MBB6217705.1 putative amidophosphoribosyltransferase [Anaerosolibacter carboniphilus]